MRESRADSLSRLPKKTVEKKLERGGGRPQFLEDKAYRINLSGKFGWSKAMVEAPRPNRVR